MTGVPKRLTGEPPEFSEFAADYYGWCGTPEIEASQGCLQCLVDRLHGPFHDGGEPCSETLHLWEPGGEFAAPRHEQGDL